MIKSSTGKEKPSLAGKSSSLDTDDDRLRISLIQKQTEDEMSVGDKSSSSGVDVSNQNVSDSQKQAGNEGMSFYDEKSSFCRDVKMLETYDLRKKTKRLGLR